MKRITGPLNKTGLAAAVAGELGVSLDEGFRALNAVIDSIARTVAAGHDVTITNFGTFRAIEAPSRKARNPQTGERVQVPARADVRFRVSPRLRAVVRAGDPSASIRKRPSK
jgi:nucleoid DNA-binding protein